MGIFPGKKSRGHGMCMFNFLIDFLIFAPLSDIKYSLTRILICIFLRTNEFEPLFVCSLAVCISFSVKYNYFCLF